MVSSVQEGVFTGWLSDFGALYPEIRYQVYSGNTYQLLEQVRTSQLDLAVVRTPFSAPDLEKITLRREPLMAVGREKFSGEKAGGPASGGTGPKAADPVPALGKKFWKNILRPGD